MFDYEHILTALNEEKLEVTDYKKFGLFYDSELFNTSMSEKQITERLKDNQALFFDVDMIHQYGPVDIGLERHFDDHGVKILSNVDWQDADFGIVRRSNQKKLEGKLLEYIEPNKKVTLEGMSYWEKSDGETKSKQRKRNIIIFNPDQHRTVTLEFPFNDFVKNQYITCNTLKHKMEAEQSGKKIKS
ncbi:hypothetical protein HMSSN036_74650 [Paenibacillus macerans]|nr:hypothetical protein HMSSN036_74650 [Paenibacillus macerans]